MYLAFERVRADSIVNAFGSDNLSIFLNLLFLDGFFNLIHSGSIFKDSINF